MGESGLGKTTFVRNMLAPLAQHAHFPLADAGAYAGLDTFANSPEKMCTEVVVRDEQRRYVHLVLVKHLVNTFNVHQRLVYTL